MLPTTDDVLRSSIASSASVERCSSATLEGGDHLDVRRVWKQVEHATASVTMATSDEQRRVACE
jgi:hypothetical protein